MQDQKVDDPPPPAPVDPTPPPAEEPVTDPDPVTPVEPPVEPDSKPVAPAYPRFGEAVNEEWPLTGVVLWTGRDSGDVTLHLISGAASVAGVVIDDTVYVLRDGDGPDTEGRLTDGRVTYARNNALSLDRGHLTVYHGSYAVSGQISDVLGVVGIATRSADMPNSGQAVFTGRGDAIFTGNGAGVDLSDGQARVSADFEAGRATIILDRFAARDLFDGRDVTAPFDQIRVDNMEIAWGLLRGGTVSFHNAGATVMPTGAGGSAIARGRFFGQATTGGPDEVGGAILVTGPDGRVEAIFSAD